MVVNGENKESSGRGPGEDGELLVSEPSINDVLTNGGRGIISSFLHSSVSGKGQRLKEQLPTYYAQDIYTFTKRERKEKERTICSV